MDFDLCRRMERSHRCRVCKGPLVTAWDGTAHVLRCAQGHQRYERIKNLTEEWDEGAVMPQAIADKLEKKYGRKSMAEQIKEKGLIVRPISEPVSIEDLAARAKDLDRFYRMLMQEGTDYGVIPGTPKPSLWKPGAELLRLWSGLRPIYDNDDSRSDRKAGYIHWLSTCRLLNKAGEVVGELSGTCNSHEAKYRWRWVWERELPPNIDKNGLVSKVINQRGDVKWRIENDNPADLDNTILKMSQKRAFVGDILMVTGASRIFTQTIEEEDEEVEGNGKEPTPESPPAASAPPPTPTFIGTVPPVTPPEPPKAQAKTEKPRGQLPLNGPKHDWDWFCKQVVAGGWKVTAAMAKLGIEKADQWTEAGHNWDEALAKVKG